MSKTIRIGTRDSELALWQAQKEKKKLKIAVPNIEMQKANLEITKLRNKEKSLKNKIESLREKQILQIIINCINQ